MKNWAGNYEFRAARVHRPSSVEETQEIVAGVGKARALGTRHSFNAIADSSEDLISTERLDRIVSIDRDRRTVTVEGGLPYGRLCQTLDAEGFAIPNLASLPHISVAGAVATATHGSGERNGNLSTAVSALEIVTADGGFVRLSREVDGDRFAGAVVGLGGLGVVVGVTLDLEPAFTMRQWVYEGLSFELAVEHLDEIEASGYSVSLFTGWSGPDIDQVWVKRREEAGDPPATLFGARLAPDHRHPIPGVSAENCSPQMGVSGPWYARLPHFRMEFTPSNGEELQAEYIVAREHAGAALREIDGLRERIAPYLHTSEIRTVAADDLWMSPSYRRDSLCIHFTWKPEWETVRALLPVIEERLAPFDARPHWGKLFTMPGSRIAGLYPRMDDFRDLLRIYDPEGKFRNAYLDETVFDSR
ncbi:FAD-binding protein [soil metagenome]